ncbi:hypothetical protein LOD99_4248 [Oopsacas minuta]|uniref:Fibronectin type-III domain-containing protein n=1 Tax=Oopsacas minuta TaxID=111878 RepID=A0AAV7JVC8_9METZ|nr:hypothetical protein LOD99_4248 [Oopsacas minuta]
MQIGSNVAGSSESHVLINVFSPPAPPQIISLFPLFSTPPSPDTTSLFLNWTMEEDGGSPVLSYVIRYTAILATPSLTQEVVVDAIPRELIIDSLVPYTTYEVSQLNY